jgi:hypothetical protein
MIFPWRCLTIEDLPADFEANRDDYYKALNLPLDPDRFITELQDEMREALGTLDGGLKKNPYVRISPKGGGRITLTPLDAQPDPPNLTAFKAELNATWPMTSLLDMVKETDLRLGFTAVLKSPTTYEMLERSVLQPRLLLCLHGIGTLHSEALRREIHEGPNVVEQWNGATDFVFFARRGEMVSNRRENHEISMLAPHLIQNCMVYVNTLMIQKVLAQPHWQGKLTPATTPL